MTARPFIVPACFALHAAGEEALAAGFYERAAYLFFEAADCALTPTGASVLREKAVEAARQTRQPRLAEAGDPASREGTPHGRSALVGDRSE